MSAAVSYPPEAVMTIHLCWLDTLARAGGGATMTIDVLTFRITGAGIRAAADLDHLRERVEALGGHLTITSPHHGGAVVACSLPTDR